MRVAISWWGHASTTVAFGRTRILTDPVFTERLAHLRRVDSPRPVADAHRAELVVISHLHRDHLHVPSLLMLPADTRIVAPRGAAAAVAAVSSRLAGRIEEVAPGESVRVAGVSIAAVPAHHDGRRSPGSRFSGPALGYLLRASTGPTVWFAGDTGLFDAMTDLGPVDVAVVPIGGWGPTLGPEHLDPIQAVEAVRRVGADTAVPMHYGTFWPTGLRRLHPDSFQRCFREPGPKFAAEFHRVLPEARAHLLSPGQTAVLT